MVKYITLKSITDNNLRIDKWLWATRIYKTRSIATDACKNKQISINGVYVKPSRIIQVGDIIDVKKPPITMKYRVKGLLAQRQSAKVVVDYIEDITPQSEIEQLMKIKLQRNVYREPGLGRPTKKDRRSLEDFGYL